MGQHGSCRDRVFQGPIGNDKIKVSNCGRERNEKARSRWDRTGYCRTGLRSEVHISC